MSVVGTYEKLIGRRETSLLLLRCYLRFDTVSPDPWTSGRFDFPYLRIPSHRQPDEEAYCVPYALWMVISYVTNEYDDPTIREKTSTVKTWELVDMLDPDPLLGWSPNQSDLTNVSAKASTVTFSLEEWPGDPPKSVLDLAKENLDDNLPLIAFVDSHLLRTGIRSGRGADHSVVICGLGTDRHGDDMAVLADPWFAALHEWNQEKGHDAWDPSRHQIIDIGLNQKRKSGQR